MRPKREYFRPPILPRHHSPDPRFHSDQSVLPPPFRERVREREKTMRVAYITAGAAGMYCGSCMRDNTLVRALRCEGVDGILIPTYTPLRTDVEDISTHRIFFGGIGVYLSQKFPIWRKAPRFFSRILASPALLKFVSRFVVNNQPQELGDLTLSILRGEKGHHKKEVDELCKWLDHLQPDIVHLTNSMFTGLAPVLRRRLGVPVICTLQGEDLFLDALLEPFRTQALDLIRENSEAVDGFVAVSEYCRQFMSEFIGIPIVKINVVRPGLPGEFQRDFLKRKETIDQMGKSTDPARVNIGYMARICEEKGAGLLGLAFARLKEMPGMEAATLRLAGYLGPADRPFVNKLMKDLNSRGLADDVELVGTLDYEGKLEFLASLDIFCVPAVFQEPKGLYVLEAFATGLPVVLPDHGAFGELVEATGGGVLTTPNSPQALAEGLFELVNNVEMRHVLGERALKGFSENYSDLRMARETLKLYKRHL